MIKFTLILPRQCIVVLHQINVERKDVMATKNKTDKRLIKSSDKMILGVCAGIGQYVNIDPTVVRLGWIIITALTGIFPGIIAYVIAAIVIPEK